MAFGSRFVDLETYVAMYLQRLVRVPTFSTSIKMESTSISGSPWLGCGFIVDGVILDAEDQEPVCNQKHLEEAQRKGVDKVEQYLLMKTRCN